MRKMILSLLSGVALSLALSVGVAAQQAEIEGTISSQIDAFRADDFDRAFTYASPLLQRLFQTPQNFERMVTQGYPMVWRPAQVDYLELQEYEGDWWQKVQIIDQKGARHLLLYRMQQTDAGWRIAGVQILEAPPPTV